MCLKTYDHYGYVALFLKLFLALYCRQVMFTSSSIPLCYVQLFIAACVSVQYRHIVFDIDLATTEVRQAHIRKDDILPLSIENLLHHSSIEDNAKGENINTLVHQTLSYYFTVACAREK